jgi:pyrroline-5-carboxylate reductase
VNVKRLAILGTGSMGKAILAGLIKSGFEPSNITATTKSDASADALNAEYGILAFALENGDDANQMAVAGADVVLIAVKPAYVIETLREVADNLDDNALVISVAAGITIEAMQKATPDDVAVIRAMPNTPAIVGRAVTGLAAGDRATEADLGIAKALFETVGKTITVDESKIDALSTISGSGPAYVFYLIEQLTAAAQAMGFAADEASLMVNETFLGASLLLEGSDKTPAELRRQVTSPNGTTERAITALEAAGLQETFEAAAGAALARAREIADGNR